MPIDAKHEDLQSLRIDRSAHAGEPSNWARRYIVGGIAVVVLLGVIALAYRLLSPDIPEVQVTRAAAESGDKVKEGQVLVRLEDEEFRAQYEQAKGAADNARAFYEELQNGSRPEEVQEAQHNLDEARATLVNDKLTLDRSRDLANQGVVSKQSFDDATAKFESDQQRVNSLEKVFQLSKLGPRKEEIARA